MINTCYVMSKTFLCIFFVVAVFCDEHTHRYVENEQVVLWMNTVGPYHNLQETYEYFSLPFCKGQVEHVEHYHESLAEALQGIKLEFSGLAIRFKQSVPKTIICSVVLTPDMASSLISAIKRHYWYQMYLDELSLSGFVGEMRDGKPVVWSHKKLEILFNEDQIIGVSLGTSNPVEVASGVHLDYSYEVSWVKSSLPFESRTDFYLDSAFYHHRIHWFSILNSFMMVVFLVILVAIILLRTLHKDYARYSKGDNLEDLQRELGDDYGWKQVHTDVFRPPFRILYFSSLVGNGVHITVSSILVPALTFVGKIYTERAGVLSAIIFIYVLSAPVNGFFGGRTYANMGGKNWIRQLFVGSLLVPLLLAVVALGINALAFVYQTSRTIPFGTVFAVLAIVLFAILPLNLIGTVVGRNLGRGGSLANPCRVSSVPRPIPDGKWLSNPLTISLLAGLLPFGSIFIEMYFIFTSFWAYKVYYVFGFTLLVILILIAVTSCVAVVGTYFLLNAEDYRWHWISFSSGASTALYVYIYATYYFFFKTKMFGLFQTVFYFSYMAFFCFALGCMCGAIGYLASNRFVHAIYSTVKID